MTQSPTHRPAARARAALLAAHWAMMPATLATLVSIADRDNFTPEAVAAELGRPLDNSHAVTVRDGVATIPIQGPIVRRADMFSEISGATSIERLATDLRQALDAPAVRAIILSVDSPGGEVNGLAETAAMIRAASAQKRMVAYVGGLGGSAAYWLACAAPEVVVAADALVGSIGVVAGIADPDKRAGRTIEFVSSQSPHKRPDPRTEGGRAKIQGTVDALAGVFIADVARYRGIRADAVTASGGDLLVGQAAVTAKLADRVGSYEGVLAELRADARPRGRGPAPAARAAPAASAPTASAPAAQPNRYTTDPAYRREVLSYTATGRAVLAQEDATTRQAAQGKG